MSSPTKSLREPPTLLPRWAQQSRAVVFARTPCGTTVSQYPLVRRRLTSPTMANSRGTWRGRPDTYWRLSGLSIDSPFSARIGPPGRPGVEGRQPARGQCGPSGVRHSSPFVQKFEQEHARPGGVCQRHVAHEVVSDGRTGPGDGSGQPQRRGEAASIAVDPDLLADGDHGPGQFRTSEGRGGARFRRFGVPTGWRVRCGS